MLYHFLLHSANNESTINHRANFVQVINKREEKKGWDLRKKREGVHIPQGIWRCLRASFLTEQLVLSQGLTA